MINKTLQFILVSGFILALSVQSCMAEGDALAGQDKFLVCAGCHAIPGYSNTYPRFQVPKLGGQHPDFLMASLKQYAANERQHATMIGTALSLSDQDMQDIVAYLSGIKFAKNIDSGEAFGDADLGKKLTENCAGCHGKRGKSSSAGFPHLAGQYESYLIHALNGYKNGTRSNPMMTGMAAALSEDDIENIAAFYSSQRKGLATPVTPKNK